MSLPALVAQTSPENANRDAQVWKEISQQPTKLAAVLSTGDSLLAVGGVDKGRRTVSAIYLCQPDTGKWVKVDDLPYPRRRCTCVMIGERELMVAGGHGDGPNPLKSVHITLISQVGLL